MNEIYAKKYKKKPVVVEASRWFKNGDHPHDNCDTLPGGQYSEGAVVRYFRSPDEEYAGHKFCKQPNCNDTYHYHGWIDTLEGGHIVCPGDYIITGVKGERYPCKPDIFEATYEEYNEAEGKKDPAPLLTTEDIERLERLKDLVINIPDPFAPWKPDQPFFGSKSSCGHCGIKFEGVTMYACPKAGCPMGLGPITCQVTNGTDANDAANTESTVSSDTTFIDPNTPNTFTTSTGETGEEATRV